MSRCVVIAVFFAFALAAPAALAVLPAKVGSPPTKAERKALSHLLASGMAAAWNARGAVDPNQAPTVVIGDNWGNGKPPNLFSGKNYIDAEIVGGGIDPNPLGLSASNHGYHTTGIVFGSFANDGTAKGVVTGSFARRGRLNPIDGYNDGSLWGDQTKFAPAINAVPGRVVVNTSLSDGPDSSGANAVDWIEQVRSLGLEDRVFHATAAGNDGALGGTAGASSSWSAAATRTDLEDNGTPVPPLTNTVSVENATELRDSSALGCLNPQSNTGGSIAAPGSNVRSFGKNGQPLDLSGTSEASPLVAGLAAYLWSIAPDLTPQQLRTAMLENADLPPQGCTSAPLVDAYAATLSLDPTGTPDPATWHVRFAILDKDANGAFNQRDLQAFAPRLRRSLQPAKRDWSRFDLNGDGFTGGGTTAPFDLDRTNSTRAGQTGLASAAATIETIPATYNETAVADADILCFYAYSPLYSGSANGRKQELKKLCKPPIGLISDSVAAIEAEGCVDAVGCDEDEKSVEGFTSVDKRSTAHLKKPHGEITAHSSQNTSLTGGLRRIVSRAAGDAQYRQEPPDHRSSAFGGGGLDVAFTIDSPVHYSLGGSMKASGNRNAQCSYVQVLLRSDGPDIFDFRAASPAGCSSPATTSLNKSGTLAPGSYRLETTVRADGTSETRTKGSASASYNLKLLLSDP